MVRTEEVISGTRRERGAKMACTGVEAGANERSTLIRGIDAVGIRVVGVGVEEKGIKNGDGTQGRRQCRRHKVAYKCRCADGSAENAMTSEGSSTGPTEHGSGTCVKGEGGRLVTEDIDNVAEEANHTRTCGRIVGEGGAVDRSLARGKS